MNPRRIAASVATGLAAGLAVRLLRGFPWGLSGVVALAVAVLTGMALRTVAQLRDIWGPDRR